MTRRCQKNLALMAQVFENENLAPEHYRTLWRELERCDTCRTAYDDMVKLERMLVTGGKSITTPGPIELRMVRERVTLALEPRRSLLPSWLNQPWLLVPTAALAMLVALVWRDNSVEQPEFLARGALTPAAISVFCQGGDRVRPLAAQDANATCSSHDALAFAYTSQAASRVSIHYRSGVSEGWLAQNQAVQPTRELSPLGIDLPLEKLSGDVTLTLLSHDASISPNALTSLITGSAEVPGVNVRQQRVRLAP